MGRIARLDRIDYDYEHEHEHDYEHEHEHGKKHGQSIGPKCSIERF